MKVSREETWAVAALARREFLTLIRSARVYLALAVFVAASIATVAWSWPERGMSIALAGAVARDIISRLSFLLLGGCVIFVPALAATSIVGEREQDTLDLLRLTLIRPEGLVLGKLLTAVGFFLALVLATLPALGAGLYLVGLDWRELAWTLMVLLATVMCCGMAGIAASAFTRKTLWAVGGAFAIAFASVTILPGILGIFLIVPAQVARGGFGPQPSAWVASPPVMLQAVSGQIMAPYAFLVTVALQLLIGAMWFLVALAGLRAVSPEPPRVQQFKPIDDPRILRERRTTWPFYLIDPMARKKPIEDHRNPMMMKELRYGAKSRGDLMAWTFIVTSIVGFFGAAVAWLNPNDPEAARSWMTVQLVGLVLAAPALLANALTKEYELGNIDMLRMTLLTPGQIVVGKLSGGAMVLAPVLGGAAVSCLMLIHARPQEAGIVLGGWLTMLVSALLSLGLGLLASLLTTRTGTALVLTYAFTIFVFFGTTFLVRMYDTYTGGATMGTPVELGAAHALNLDSPIFAYLRTMRPKTVMLGAWLRNLALYSALCAALLTVSVQGFTRYRLRDD